MLVIALQGMPEFQLSCGVIRDVEVAVSCNLNFINNIQLNKAIIKADFKNTFNSIRRDKCYLLLKSSIQNYASLSTLVFIVPILFRSGQ